MAESVTNAIVRKHTKDLVEDDEVEEAELVSLHKLPEELIEMVFSFLNDPGDLLNVSNTSSQFTRIVHPRKPVFMFEEVFPLIFGDLDREDIYNCRLVCKQWNRSVDSHLQTIPESRYLEPYPYDFTKTASGSGSNSYPLQKAIMCNKPPYRPVLQPLIRSKELFPIIFEEPGKLSNFLHKTSTHPGNPFILRMITLGCEDVRRREFRGYWREIIGSLLQNFGQEVHHLSLSPTLGRSRDHDVFPYYTILRRTLRMLPNLKSLHLYRHSRYIPPVSDQLADRIEEHMDIYPLPPLPHLETLTETFLDKLPQEPVFNELMKKYSSQLKTIDFSLAIWQEDIPEFSNFPQCTSLYMCVDGSLKKWRQLCRQLEVPNLGKLSLTLKTTWGISQILQPLQQANFQSLVYLKLRFVCKLGKDRRGGMPHNQFVLELVKTLEVFDNSNVPYDFLLNYLPKLEYMLVCCDPRRMNCLKYQESLQDGIFEIRKWIYSKAMYKSNIWVKMEHLKEFVVAKLGDTGDTENEIDSTVIYNREQYNRLTQVKNPEGKENLEE